MFNETEASKNNWTEKNKKHLSSLIDFVMYFIGSYLTNVMENKDFCKKYNTYQMISINLLMSAIIDCFEVDENFLKSAIDILDQFYEDAVFHLTEVSKNNNNKVSVN